MRPQTGFGLAGFVLQFRERAGPRVGFILPSKPSFDHRGGNVFAVDLNGRESLEALQD